MAWFLLILGGLFEVGFTTCLGYSNGFKSLPWTAGFIVCLVLSMACLAAAARSLPLGTAYAVWTGIGAVGTALVGIFLFREPAHFWRVFFLVTLILSIVGLKAASGGGAKTSPPVSHSPGAR